MSALTQVKVIEDQKTAVVKHPLHRAHRSGHPKNVITVNSYNSIVAGSFTNSGTVTFRIPSETLQVVSGVILKWTVTETAGSAVQIPPVQFFSQSIEIRMNDGTQLVNTIYPECEHWATCSLVDRQDQTPRFFDDNNMSSAFYLGADSTIGANGKRVFYQRIRTSVFSYLKPYTKNMGYTELRVKCQPIVVSGGGTASLSNLQVLIEEERLTQEEEQMALSLQMSNKQEFQYLDWLKISSQTQTITAGTEYSFDLSGIGSKHVPFLLFAIRADSYSNSSAGTLKFIGLGSQNTSTEATLNLADPSGRKVLDNGSGDLDYEYVKNALWNQHFSSDFNTRNLLVVPMCASIKDAMKGIKNGYIDFTPDKWSFRIRPSSAGTSCVQALTSTHGSNNGGFYRLAFKGDLSDPLAHSATVGSMKTAFEALPACQNYPGGPLTVTFSAQASAGSTNATFASTLPPPRDNVTLISETLNASGTGEKSTTSVTTQGNEGFTTGSTYTIDCYVPFFNSLWSKNGRVKVTEHV